MLKNLPSIILLVIFASFVVTPTVVSMMDCDADISVVFNVSEEENKERETQEDKEIEISQIVDPNYPNIEFSGIDYAFYTLHYTQHYAILNAPPPKKA